MIITTLLSVCVRDCACSLVHYTGMHSWLYNRWYWHLGCAPALKNIRSRSDVQYSTYGWHIYRCMTHCRCLSLCFSIFTAVCLFSYLHWHLCGCHLNFLHACHKQLNAYSPLPGSQAVLCSLVIILCCFRC